MCYNIDESGKCFAKWNNLVTEERRKEKKTKQNIAGSCLCKRPRIIKFLEIESGMVAAMDWSLLGIVFLYKITRVLKIDFTAMWTNLALWSHKLKT